MRAPRTSTRGNGIRVFWDAPDTEWLAYHYLELGKPARLIAKDVGCSVWTAKNWLRNAGLRNPVKVSDDPLAPMRVGRGSGKRFTSVTREWLFQEYVEKDKSTKQIAAEIGASHHGVWKWLLKHDIPTRTREEMNERHSSRMSGDGNPAWQGGTARNYQARLLSESGCEKVCEWCGETEELQVHHYDHNTKNGNLENLVWMCRHCNMVEAHLWALDKKDLATWLYQDGQLTVQFMEVTK